MGNFSKEKLHVVITFMQLAPFFKAGIVHVQGRGQERPKQ